MTTPERTPKEDAMTTPAHTPSGTPVNGGWVAYFAGNPVAANILMLFILVAGVASGLQLVVQALPDIDLRTVTVTVRAPGVSPREVEEDIIRRVEESVIGAEGVARVVSTATESLGVVTLELTTFAHGPRVLADVRQAVDAIENFPPANAERPEVELDRVNPEAITLAVLSDTRDENGLRLAAEEVRDQLLGLPAVALVDLIGARDREIAIELDQEALHRYNLSLSGVAREVSQASLNLTFGELRTEAGGVVLHTVAQRTVGEEFATIPLITDLDGSHVTLGDVATIRDAFADEEVIVLVGGVPAVLVQVTLMEGQSVITVANAVRDWLAAYPAPPDVQIRVWHDQAKPQLDQIAQLAQAGVMGVILVFLLLLLVFDLRAALWITLGIPLSFLGALLFFGPANLTWNLGTLIAMFLMIGLVVDDALVVGESIAAERERGRPPLAAAVAGVRAVASPITIAAVTTVLAFVPLYFLTDPAYQLVNLFPLVAFFVLAVSLIEALLILPAHLAHDRPWSLGPLRAVQAWTGARIDTLRDRTVAPAVAWSVRNIPITLACGVVVVVLPWLLIQFGAVRVTFFDRSSLEQAVEHVRADLYLPEGTPFETTRRIAMETAAAVAAVNEQLPGEPVRSVSVLVGHLARWPTQGAIPTGSHLAGIRAHLNEKPLRQSMPLAIAKVWERNLEPDAQLERSEVQHSSSQAPPVGFALLHEDEEMLAQATEELRAYMTGIPGLFHIVDSLAPGKRHIEIGLTPLGEAAGLTPAGVGRQLRANFHGVEVQRIQRGRDEIKVMVRYPPEDRQSLAELVDARIGGVPLSLAVTLDESREPSTRLRIDGTPAATVLARYEAQASTAEAVIREIANQFLPGLQERYPGLQIQPESGTRNTRNLLRTVILLVPIVLLAMYALMATFLRSYWKPLVAVAGLPLAISGSLLGHWILGWTFSGMSLLGMIAVFGVVVNDALVLMHRYNNLRRENPQLPAIAAASAAVRDRFRAVFLTSVTTVVGLSPLLYERSDSLLFVVPFVISVLGGIILSSLFILFVLPTLVLLAAKDV